MTTPTLENLKEAESHLWLVYKAACEIAEEKNIEWKAAYRAVVNAKEELKKQSLISTKE